MTLPYSPIYRQVNRHHGRSNAPPVKQPFNWPVRVYYEDTDTGGIVFYANYLKYFERARTEWLRSGGIDQSRLTATHGIMFVVMRTTVDYHAPARLDDALVLTVAIEKLGRASVDFMQYAWRRTESEAASVGSVEHVSPTPVTAQLIASGKIKVACVDLQTLRPRAIPPEVVAFMHSCMSGRGEPGHARQVSEEGALIG